MQKILKTSQDFGGLVMNEFKPRMTKKYKTLLTAVDNKAENIEYLERIKKKYKIKNFRKDLPVIGEHEHIYAPFFESCILQGNFQMRPSDMLSIFKEQLDESTKNWNWSPGYVLVCDWLHVSDVLLAEYPELNQMDYDDLRECKMFEVECFNPNAKKRFLELCRNVIDQNIDSVLYTYTKRKKTLFVFKRELVMQSELGYRGKKGYMYDFYQILTTGYKRY